MSNFKPLLAFTFSFAIFFANTGRLSAQENRVLDRANLMRLEAARLAEMERLDLAAAARAKALKLTQHAENQQRKQVLKTELEIAELSSVLRRLEFELEGVASEEDERHLKREAQRINREIERRTAELHSLKREDERRAENRDEHDDEAHEHERDEDHEHAHDEEHREHGDEHDRGEKDRDELRFRLEHLHQAIGHLHESGLHEIAEQVEEHAGHAERELEKREGHRPERMMQEMMERIEMLTRQVDELRREVHRLRK